jgi:hypothetical protein
MSNNNFLRLDYPCSIQMYGKIYPSLYHALLAAPWPQEDELREKIRTTLDAKQALAMTKDIDQPATWADRREQSIQTLLNRKFSDTDLRKQLAKVSEQDLLLAGEKIYPYLKIVWSQVQAESTVVGNPFADDLQSFLTSVKSTCNYNTKQIEDALLNPNDFRLDGHTRTGIKRLQELLFITADLRAIFSEYLVSIK